MLRIFYFLSANRPNLTRTVICKDLLGTFFLMVIELNYNLGFLNRLRIVIKVPSWKRILIYFYILIMLLVIPFCPNYYFFPIRQNVNTTASPYTAAYSTNEQLLSCFIELNNVYFTLEFAYFLCKYKGSRYDAFYIISIKSIIHCFTSVLANELKYHIPIYDDSVFPMLIVLNLHFLFNY